MNKTKPLQITNFTKFAKLIFDEINKARHNPGAYAHILQGYLDKIEGNKIFINNFPTYIQEGKSAIEEAIEFLEDVQPLPELKFTNGLYESADKLLNVLILHDGLDMNDEQNQYEIEKRVNLYGKSLGLVEEIIDLGCFDPSQMVAQFIICDGDEERKERGIIFSEKINYVGISSGIMPSEKVCTVLDFAEQYFNPDDYVDDKIIKYYVDKTVDYTVKRKNSRDLYKAKQDRYNKVGKCLQLNELLKSTDDLNEDTLSVTYGEKVSIENGVPVTTVKKTIHYRDGSIDSILFKK